MKKINNPTFSLLICALFCALTTKGQNITIPDVNFKNALINSLCIDLNNDLYPDIDADTNDDGELQVTEAESITRLYVNGKSIGSLDGIENFTNLFILDCSHNNLQSLTFSMHANLYRLNCEVNILNSLDLGGAPNLVLLFCGNNNLTSINLQGQSKLELLNCFANKLTSLDLSGLDKLIKLDCSQNQITTLDLQDFDNLTEVKCQSNYVLISLLVQGLTKLMVLNCEFNMLNTINLQGLDNLSKLICDNNQITILDVSNLPKLIDLQCFSNLITSLDLQNSQHLETLHCYSNQLISLFIKNGIIETNINLSGNYNLTYVCCDDAQSNEIKSLLGFSGLTNYALNTYCSFTPGGDFYSLQGRGILDLNNNGCDAQDGNYPNLKYSLDNGIDTWTFIAPEFGDYTIPLPSGTHNLTPILENPAFFNVSPVSITLNLPVDSNNLLHNFCFTANGTHHDVEITLLPTTPARPGFPANYQIIYKNKGNQVENGTISLSFQEMLMDFLDANTPIDVLNAGNFIWNFSNLLPFEKRIIDINFRIKSPEVNLGDLLTFEAIIDANTPDETIFDNKNIVNQTVVGAFDPNAKTCLEGESITPTMVGRDLHYVIQFENTGTYPAENIVVKDVIDTTKFELSSLQIINTSHQCYARIVHGNEVEFIFENINLPFTEPDKHGLVGFKIKTKTSLVLGQEINNYAEIFFDYNLPIVTDTAKTLIVPMVYSADIASKPTFFVQIKPNPAYDVIKIDSQEQLEFAEIFDVWGHLKLRTSLINKPIELTQFENGVYFIKIFTKDGFVVKQFVKQF
jgi:uncharacterized repeat protein (TIGR01451 family)